MSCSWMCFRYCVWFGVRPCRSARRVRSSGAPSSSAAARGCALRRELDQAELDVVDRQRLLGLRRRSAAAPAPRASSASACRRSVNVAAAVRDRDVERGLDLAQVRVERAAQIGERAVVERRERELVPLASAAHAAAASGCGAAALKRLAAPSAPSAPRRACSRLRPGARASPCRDCRARAAALICAEQRFALLAQQRARVGRRRRRRARSARRRCGAGARAAGRGAAAGSSRRVFSSLQIAPCSAA